MPSAQHALPIPSTYARNIARILALQERDLPELLRGTALPTDILMPGDETFITGQQQLTLMENGQRLMNTDTFGLRLGAPLEPSAYGPLGYLALSSPDLLSSLRSLRDFLPVRLPIATFEIIQDKNGLPCVYRINLATNEEVRRAVCECFILVIQSLLVEAVRGCTAGQGSPSSTMHLQIVNATKRFTSTHRISFRAAEPHTPCPPLWQLLLTFVATRMLIRSLRACAANYCSKPRTRPAP